MWISSWELILLAWVVTRKEMCGGDAVLYWAGRKPDSSYQMETFLKAVIQAAFSLTGT